MSHFCHTHSQQFPTNLEFRGDPFSRIFTQSKDQGPNEWGIRNRGIQDIPEYSREINAVKKACSELEIYVKEFYSRDIPSIRESLKRIADSTGGKYFRATNNEKLKKIVLYNKDFVKIHNS